MRIPPMGYLTLASLCGELACVVIRAFAGTFPTLIVGVVASPGSVLAAMRWEE